MTDIPLTREELNILEEAYPNKTHSEALQEGFRGHIKKMMGADKEKAKIVNFKALKSSKEGVSCE